MSMKIKKGDTVKVIAGKDKDKTGKVVSVDVKNNRVVVEGVNMITKHEKPSMSNQQGGIVNKEAPIDASNVMLVVKGVPTRVGIKVDMQCLFRENARKSNIHWERYLQNLRFPIHSHQVHIRRPFSALPLMYWKVNIPPHHS